MPNDPFRATPKQKRGQRRVDAILNAATELFAEVGYDHATIQQIATRADTSVGSIYQFFVNKEALLKAIVERYVARASVVFANINVEAFPTMTLETSVRAILTPLKDFIRDNLEFQVIFSTTSGSVYVEQVIRAMDEAFIARTDASIAMIRPDLLPTQRRKYALVCMMIMKALLNLAHQSQELSLDEIFEELEAVYLRYLTPLDIRPSHTNESKTSD